MFVPHLILLFDAPLTAFGAAAGRGGASLPFPGRSQLAGLFGNALGFDHAETNRLQRLQDRMRTAAVMLREGEDIVDKVTASGVFRTPDGGRRCRANATLLVSVSFSPADETPTVFSVAEAIEYPARPLFIGRKFCLPAVPPYAGILGAANPLSALVAGMELPRVIERRRLGPGREPETLFAEWPAGDPIPGRLSAVQTGDDEPVVVLDGRNWASTAREGGREVRRDRLAGWPHLPVDPGSEEDWA